MYLLNSNEHVLKSDKLSFLLYYFVLFRLCKNAFLIVSDTFWGPYIVKRFPGGSVPRPGAQPLDPAGGSAPRPLLTGGSAP